MPIPGSPGVYAVSRASEKHATIDHVIATAGESSVVVRVSDDSFGNSDFDAYSWDTVSATDFAFIHTDRPLYRPGDTVSFRGIVRRFDPRAGYRPYPSDRPLVVSYRDSTGNRSVESISVSANANGNFSGSFVVPADAKLGRNEFSVIPADDDSGNGLKIKGEFFVEEYKKPVFKTLVDVPHPDALYGDTIDVSAHGEYYFGGILKGARYQYDVLSQRAFLDR
ncbi:MAG TPA: MG2 domain-containing protein [bacterium]|nr:MG2 domain-containing protein [bacterium]